MIKKPVFRPLLNTQCYAINRMLLVKYTRVVSYLDTSNGVSILLLLPPFSTLSATDMVKSFQFPTSNLTVDKHFKFKIPSFLS